MKRIVSGTIAAVAMIVLPLMVPGAGMLSRVHLASAASLPTIAGEVFQQTSMTVASSSTGCLPPDDGASTVTNSTFNFTATGTASGPVKGTYSMSGSFTTGDTAGVGSPVNVLSVSGSFTITGSNGVTLATGSISSATQNGEPGPGLDPYLPTGVPGTGFCVQAQESIDTEIDLNVTTGGVNLASEAEFIVAPSSTSSPPAQTFQLNFQTSTTVSCNTSIDMPFDGTAIPSGDYIWIPAVLDVKGLPKGSPATINFTGSTVTFTANGVPYSYGVPNGSITFSTTATSASTTYNNGTWSTIEPAGLGAQGFTAGVTIPVPAGGLPGGIKPVTWSGQIGSATHGLTVHWQWGAAVYTNFTNPTTNPDYGTVNVKPVDGPNANPYANGDQGGTPESFKQFYTSGARDNGWSATGSCTT